MRWLEELTGSVRAGTEEGQVDANAGFVVTRRGALLVDAFSAPADGRPLYEAARTEAGQVVGLVYTHEHGDHVFGSADYPDDLLILASRDTAAGLRAAVDRYAEDIARYGLVARFPTLEFEARVVLPWEPEIVIAELGGHARGSTVVFVPSTHVLFAGDLVFAAGAAWVGHGDLDRWIAALRELEGWGATRVVPGHGPVGGPEVLTRQRQWLESFAGRLGQLRADGEPAGAALTRLVEEFELNEKNGYNERLWGVLETALRERFGFS